MKEDPFGEKTLRFLSQRTLFVVDGRDTRGFSFILCSNETSETRDRTETYLRPKSSKPYRVPIPSDPIVVQEPPFQSIGKETEGDREPPGVGDERCIRTPFRYDGNGSVTGPDGRRRR